MENIIIQAVNLNKQYNQKVHAVKNVDLSIEQGKFYLIKGRSGSGKTTLLHLLSLLDSPTSGDILVEQESLVSLSDNKKAEIRANKFGFIFQSFYLNQKLKAYENVMLPMYVGSKKHQDFKNAAFSLLEQVGLKERIYHFPKELSGGEQQRVAVARALANDPQCIFADEPTGNLDKENEISVLNLLKELSKNGKTIVVVSHNEIVENYADKIYTMDDGILTEV